MGIAITKYGLIKHNIDFIKPLSKVLKEINDNPDSIEHLEEKQKAVEETINNIIEIKGD